MSKSCLRFDCAAEELLRINSISSRVLDPSQGALDSKLVEENSHVIKTGYKCFLSLLDDLQANGIIVSRKGLILDFMARHSFLEFLQLTEEWELAFLSQLTGCKSNDTNETQDVTARYYNVYVSSRTRSATSLFGALRQMAKLLKKLRINRSDLEASLTEQLIADDASLNDAIDFSEMRGVIVQMNRIIKRWTSKMDLSFLPFRHGTGAVANKAPSSGSLQWKDDVTFIDPKIAIAARLTGTSMPRINSGVDVLPSKQVFVPKTAKTLRGICEESVSRQFFQQGVMRYWYDYIYHDRFLREHFPIHDQTVNQNLAQLGSWSGSLATLDLSKASDTVSWKLVKQLFHGTVLYPWMIATRAQSCKYQDGRILPLNKYAPMGSALCFPTEGTVFGAAIQYVIEDFERRFPVHSMCENWSVYGDDMVVPTEIADAVVLLLTRLGFIVNRDKSYSVGPFRESCGKDFLFGVDVTPFYVRDVHLQGKKLTPNEQDRLIQYANHCFLRGYSSMRKFFLSDLMKSDLKFKSRECYDRVLFSRPGIPSCVWTDFPEPPKGSRFNRDLWRLEVRALVIKTQVEQRCIEASNPLALYRSLIELEWGRPHRIYFYDQSSNAEKGELESDLYRKQRTCWGLRSVSISDLDY